MSVFSSTVNFSGSGTNHWHQLAVLLHHAPGTAQSFLRRPPPPGIPSGKCIAEITASAQQHGLTELLEKHLLAGFLLTPQDQQNQWPPSTRALAKQLFSGADQELTEATPWIQVPVLVVQGKNGRVAAMMLGLLPNSSDCSAIGSPASDARTADAVREACRVAGWGHGVVYWFLQQGNEQQIHGNSLALPVALAFKFFSRSASWPEGLYATGGLEQDGSVVSVDHVREKYCSVQQSCQLFLAPADTALPRTADQPVHACTTFDDACFAALLYSGGTNAADILLYQACWISEHNFFNHFHELPLNMVTSDRACDFYRRIQAEPGEYLELLSRCFSRCSHDRQRGQIMADLFTPKKIQGLAGPSSFHNFAAFNWCLAALSFYNHCGQITKSRRWSSCAEPLRAMVDLKEINRFINQSFVERRFNRYDFRPQLTSELTDVLEQEKNKQKIYPGSNALLGAIYGTLARIFHRSVNF